MHQSNSMKAFKIGLLAAFVVLVAGLGAADTGDLFNPEGVGEQLWTYTGHSDRVEDVAVDGHGNVYSASFDDEVHKIDSSGNQEWTYTGHSDAVQGVAVDNDGNVYSATNDDEVHKIDSSGNQEWTYSGHTDSVQDVAVDGHGNVYSASSDEEVHKIDSSGNQEWTYTGHIRGVQGVAVDNDGNVYSASSDDEVHKIDSSGNQEWTYSGHSDRVEDVAVDGHGNVYSGGRDDEVHKIDSTGNNVWEYTGHTSSVFGVAVDQDGNVYSASTDDEVHKIDSSGNQEWTYTGHTDGVLGVAVDGDRNVYSASLDDEVHKLSFNQPPEFESVSSDPSPPQIGRNVSYSAELFDPDDDSELEEVELELTYGGETVYTDNRSVSGDNDSASWSDAYVPEQTNEWLNATFTATDTAGDSTTEELNYFLDDTPPEINIVQPENQTYWSYDIPYEIEVDSNNDAFPDQDFELEIYSDGELVEELSGSGTETFEGEFREDLGENIDFEAVANDTGGETTESTVFSVKALEFVSTGFQETVFETQENSYSAELDVGDMVEEIQVFLVYDGEQVVDDTTVFDSEIVYGHEETLSFRPGLVSSEEEVRDLYLSVSYVVEGFESGTEEKEIESSVEEQTVEKAFVPEAIDLSFDFGQSDRTVEKHSFDYILDYEDEGLSNDSISFEAETEFNGSVYTGFSGSITPGNVDGSADENVESDLLISFKGDEEIRSFETEVVTVDEVVLNTDGEGESVLAVELLDEEDNSAVESSVDFNFDTTTSQENLEKSFGFELDEVDSFDVYLDPEYAEVLVDGVFSYSSDGFRNRRYEVRNQEISSPALDLELYLIDDTVGEPVYFEVIDAAGDGVNGILETQRYSEASNSFRTVSRASIDDAESLAYLNIDDVYYRHQVRDNEGEVLRVFDRRLITCSTIPCERVLQISDDVIPFEEQRRGFDYTCSTLTDSEGGFNGVQCDVSHEDDIMQGADLKLERGRGLGTTTVCESSTSSPGQLICELDGEEDVEGYRYSYELKGHTNEYSYVLESGRFDFTDRLFQGQAPFLAVILFLSISLIGLRNYGTAVMFSVAGVFAGFAFGLLQVSAASVAGLFIVGLFYIFLHSRR